MTSAPLRLAVQRFDGVSARSVAAEAWIDGARLCIDVAGDPLRHVPVRDARWPERQRHGARVVHLPDGSSLHAPDPLAFDTWSRHHRLRESWVVKAQQNWRATAIGTVLLLVLCAGLYEWGLPWGARAALAFVPTSVDRELGDVALRSISREGWLEPSRLPREQQQRLREAWARASARTGTPVAIEIHFHKSTLGPNAFALPGGHVVMTDEMVDLVGGDEAMVVGVLAHEAAHVQHRHGMRMVAQTTLLGSLTSVAFGDFSSLLATAPAVLGHLAYSRDLEREADADAIALLRANGIPPAVMATMFERLRDHQRREGMPSLPIALGSHPPDDERIARFRDAAVP